MMQGRLAGPCKGRLPARPHAASAAPSRACGAVAEWSKALAWKVSIRQNRIEGSNPSRSASHPQHPSPSGTPALRAAAGGALTCPNPTACQNRGEFPPLQDSAVAPGLRPSRGRLGLADFPCYDAITGNFSKKRPKNRRFCPAGRRARSFSDQFSMAYAAKKQLSCSSR